ARSGNTADHAEKPLLTLLKNTAHNAERKLLKHTPFVFVHSYSPVRIHSSVHPFLPFPHPFPPRVRSHPLDRVPTVGPGGIRIR
ncbi:hypothetical protein, partial [Bifidobacterium merycicum]|uniref:hypothetical protein n=1 Tax=Bifidobacterium merycicum TaxID=78345 RepID=UPI001F252DFA